MARRRAAARRPAARAETTARVRPCGVAPDPRRDPHPPSDRHLARVMATPRLPAPRLQSRQQPIRARNQEPRLGVGRHPGPLIGPVAPDLRPVLVNSDAGSPDGTGRVVIETEPPDYIEQILLVRPTNKLSRVSLTYPEIDGVGGKGAALRTIFEIAAALEVQALVVVDSDLRSIIPEWIELLAGPIVKGGYDFVAPLYARYKYDGTITNTVTYPLTRALYGNRIRQPIGGDFGVSGDLVRHYLELDDWTDDVSKFGIDIWMTTSALTGGFAVCQTRLGAKIHDPKDPGSDLGPMFRQVVGTILRLAVLHADQWLPIR